MKINPLKPDRSRIELTSDPLIRHWTKTLGASKDEIIAAIEKVGDNSDTVRNELAAIGNFTPGGADESISGSWPSLIEACAESSSRVVQKRRAAQKGEQLTSEWGQVREHV